MVLSQVPRTVLSLGLGSTSDLRDMGDTGTVANGRLDCRASAVRNRRPKERCYSGRDHCKGRRTHKSDKMHREDGTKGRGGRVDTCQGQKRKKERGCVPVYPRDPSMDRNHRIGRHGGGASKPPAWASGHERLDEIRDDMKKRRVQDGGSVKGLADRKQHCRREEGLVHAPCCRCRGKRCSRVSSRIKLPAQVRRQLSLIEGCSDAGEGYPGLLLR